MCDFAWQVEVEHIKKSLSKWSILIAMLWSPHRRPSFEKKKTFSLLAETLQPKQCLCQMITAISNCSAPWNQPPSPHFDAALSCVYFFTFLLKEAFLFSLLLFFRSLLCHWYWLTTARRCVLPRLQNDDTEPWLSRRPHWYFMFEGNFDLRSPVSSDDLCAVLRPLCGLRLLSVCVCVCVFSIHVRTIVKHFHIRDT